MVLRILSEVIPIFILLLAVRLIEKINDIIIKDMTLCIVVFSIIQSVIYHNDD